MDRLDRETTIAQERFSKLGVRLQRNDLKVRLWLPGLVDGTVILLDGAGYDAEPMSLSVVDTGGQPVAANQWPGALCHGEHPVLRRPFACLRGLREYHAHPSHVGDNWDNYRNTIRLVDLVAHIVAKVPGS